MTRIGVDNLYIQYIRKSAIVTCSRVTGVATYCVFVQLILLSVFVHGAKHKIGG